MKIFKTLGRRFLIGAAFIGASLILLALLCGFSLGIVLIFSGYMNLLADKTFAFWNFIIVLIGLALILGWIFDTV